MLCGKGLRSISLYVSTCMHIDVWVGVGVYACRALCLTSVGASTTKRIVSIVIKPKEPRQVTL